MKTLKIEFKGRSYLLSFSLGKAIRYLDFFDKDIYEDLPNLLTVSGVKTYMIASRILYIFAGIDQEEEYDEWLDTFEPDELDGVMPEIVDFVISELQKNADKQKESSQKIKKKMQSKSQRL